jgi:hypothetical protein
LTGPLTSLWRAGDIVFKLPKLTDGAESGLIADPHVVSTELLPSDR